MTNTNEHNKANEQKWNARANTWDKKGFHYFYLRYFQKKAISIANLQENINFLDLGCGVGWAVCYAAALLNGRGNFIGIDISEGMIERAKENALGQKNISFFRASAEELPLENDFFDVIICTNSFHHYRNPMKALAEAYRVMKQKGRVYILDITSDDFLTRWIDKRAEKKEKEHVKWYSTAEYKSMFSRAGLNYIKSKTITYPSKVHIAEKSS